MIDKMNDKFVFGDIMNETEIFPLYESDDQNNGKFELDSGEVLPILPLRNMVLFPGVLLPVAVARPKSLKLVRSVYEAEKPIGVCTQLDKNVEEPEISDLYPMGVAAKIVRIFEMPDDSVTIILEGKKRFLLGEPAGKKNYLKAHVTTVDEELPDVNNNTHFVAWFPTYVILPSKSSTISVTFHRKQHLHYAT